MEYKYYNDSEYKKAMATIKNNPYKGVKELKNYLDKYHLDYTSYPYYITTLITIGEFEEAKKSIEYIESILNSGVYKDDKRRNNILISSILFSKFKLLCCEKRYNEAYNFYFSNKKIIDSFEVGNIVFFLKVELGLVEYNPESRASLPYFHRQSIDYQESDFLHHAKKHCKDTLHGNEDDETEFASGFPIEEVVSEIKKYIPSDKRLYYGFADNAYIFKYDSCGTCCTRDRKVVNYIKVVTFNDDSNIITMYPFVEGNSLPHIDLNYMRAKSSPKVKRLSQIDKFNKKFGIK